MLALLLAAAAVAAPKPNPCAALNAHRDDMAWVRANCKPLKADDDAGVREAEELLRLLARQRGARASLVVLGGAPGAQAYVTRDSVIVVTTQALDLCRRRRGQALRPEQARTNLLFLLAHELAHSHREDHVVALLAEKGERYFEFAVRSGDMRELLADQAALVDVARAGGDPQQVLGGGLLSAWARADGNPQWARERQRALREHAKSVVAALPLFQAGFDFLSSGDYDGAAEFLGAFAARARYDAREVRSNQAFALLQQAWATLAQCAPAAARRFVLPGVFDPSALALRFRSGSSTPADTCRREREFRALLDAAVALLEVVKQQDPDYTPARLNLAAAYLLDGQAVQAMAVLDAWPATSSDEARVASKAAGAVAAYLYAERPENSEGRAQALQCLRALAGRRPSDVAIAYNLARILSEMQDPAAEQAWRDVLALDPPRVLAEGARAELRHLNVDVEEPPSPAGGAPCPEPLAPTAAAPALGTTLPKAIVKGEIESSDGGLAWRRYSPKPGQAPREKATEGAATQPEAPAWRAYARRPGPRQPPLGISLTAEKLQPGVPEADLRRLHGVPEVELPLADGRRVLRFARCELPGDAGSLGYAYVVDGGEAVERLTFRPPY